LPAGTFKRGYDGVSPGWTNPSFPATVSTFLLDKYLITVGRFRQFIAAWDGGWRPVAGDGKHAHLNGGRGLVAGIVDSGIQYETGWDISWSATLATSDSDWNTHLTTDCGAQPSQVWTQSLGANENLPVTCLTWYEAYAFCVWDGGFLPSEAEWNYAAAGGDEQRVYPWSSPPVSTTIDCSYANYAGAGNGTHQVCVAPPTGQENNVGSQPKGNGKWGHADLAGQQWEWVLDWTGNYPTPCMDCANLGSGDANHYRVVRGGTYIAWDVLSSWRIARAPTQRGDGGTRCARSP
jgi:formylglycine-generating enzyme required for sulfatase activity